MPYKSMNNITGWIVFLIALVVYSLTIEQTTSFWDCGEFISGAFKLQVVHPPGAPMFLMIARVFAWFGDILSVNPGDTVAYAVNFLSGLCSALTILFLFWSITALAKKLVKTENGEMSMGDKLAIMGSGIVGGLACTFADTFWFSAVEGEVYAM